MWDQREATSLKREGQGSEANCSVTLRSSGFLHPGCAKFHVCAEKTLGRHIPSLINIYTKKVVCNFFSGKCKYNYTN